MRMVTVAGPPSTGKTSVLIHAIRQLQQIGFGSCNSTGIGLPSPHVAVVKFDCLVSDDAQTYQSAGIYARVGLSAGQCPDHFFASNATSVFSWGYDRKLDLLITESAGLCNRCSPYIEGVPAVCVLDCMAGIRAPQKMGPLLRMADLVVLTKADMISQAEREVIACRVQSLAPRAQVIMINGLTGQGSLQLTRFLQQAPQIDTLNERNLRFSTPSALCSYCLGERLLGEEHQMGNIRRIDLS